MTESSTTPIGRSTGRSPAILPGTVLTIALLAGTASVAGELDVHQDGTDGRIAVQLGTDTDRLEVTISQSGLANRLDAALDGGLHASIRQHGERGAIDLAAAGHGHTLQLDQGGLGNRVELDIDGVSNRLELLQGGAGNRLTADVSGAGHALSVDQRGTSNHIDLSQGGGGANLGLVQRGDDNALIVSRRSGGPRLIVEQLGSGERVEIRD